MNKKLKRVPAVFMAAVLVVGVAAGAGVWLLSVEVPIEYDEPYTISMSTEEENDYGWEPLQFKETTEHVTADFRATGWEGQYHQYVRVDNPRDEEVNVEFEVQEPEGFTDDMGFIVDYDGIVEPGAAEEEEVDTWGDLEGGIVVDPDSQRDITVIYTLGQDAPEDDGTHDVIWSFSEVDEIDTAGADIERTVTDEVTADFVVRENGDNNNDWLFDNLGDAVDNADEDDYVIVVEEGSYDGFTIDGKSVEIYGTTEDDVNEEDTVSVVDVSEETPVEVTGTINFNDGSVEIAGYSGTHIEGLCFTGARGFNFDGSPDNVEDITIQNNKMVDITSHGITGAGASDFQNFVVDSNIVEGIESGISGFYLLDIESGEVVNNLIDGKYGENGYEVGSRGIQLEGSPGGGELVIEHNEIKNLGDQGIQLADASDRLVDDVMVRYNTVTAAGQDRGRGALRLYDGSQGGMDNIEIRYNILQNSGSGIHVREETELDWGEVTIEYNNIVNNDVAVWNELDEEVEVTNNWWGTADTDKIDAMMDGDVDFDPILEYPIPE